MAMRNNTYIYIHPQGDLNAEIIHCGMGECDPGHSYGPAVRDHYLIHYVLSGKGVFNDGKFCHNIEKGQGFLIVPNKLTSYTADSEYPWTYIWVGFNGSKFDNLLSMACITEHNPVFKDARCTEFFLGMLSGSGQLQKTDGEVNALRILGELYRFFSHISSQNRKGQPSRQLVSDKVVDFIHNNVNCEISISNLANDFGYNRSYFCELFKKEKGISPQQYLIEYRMDLALHLLKSTDLKVSDIARSVGYKDALLFSRMFKSKNGVCPGSFRNRIKTNIRLKDN